MNSEHKKVLSVEKTMKELNGKLFYMLRLRYDGDHLNTIMDFKADEKKRDRTYRKILRENGL